MTGNTTQAEPGNAPAVRARFARTLRGIIWFAGGCAVAALLYYWIGFWCQALPVAVGAGTAILRRQE